uniref:Protein krueppel n=1 Tax=Anopheles dirus TaxID=7168 RepID=A0A182NPK8_9DIPT
MAEYFQEMLNICRFCLCRDEARLNFISETIDVSLSIQDIEIFTGIQINTDEERISHAVCLECIDIMKKFAVFRNTCLNNDALFRRLCAESFACNPKSTMDVIVERCSTPSMDPLMVNFPVDDGAISDLDGFVDEFKIEQTIADKNCPHIPTIITDQPDGGTEEFSYSANYIGLGEPSLSGDNESDATADDVWLSDPITRKIHLLNSQGSATIPSIELFKQPRDSKRQKRLCDTCGAFVTNLPTHMLNHTKHIKFSCPQCPIQMYNQANLLKHIAAVHQRRILETCSVCGKGFTHRATYLAHMRALHDIGEKLECRLCFKKFNQTSGLSKHVKRHHGGQDFACAACSKTFTSRKALEAHESSHSREQVYACSQCPKRFRTVHAHQLHERTHGGVLFKCTICGKSYRHGSVLKMH